MRLISGRMERAGRLNPTYPPASSVSPSSATEYTPSVNATSLSANVALFENTLLTTSGFDVDISRLHAWLDMSESKGLIRFSPTFTTFSLVSPLPSKLSMVNVPASSNLASKTSSCSTIAWLLPSAAAIIASIPATPASASASYAPRNGLISSCKLAL